ncbi:MAG: oxidoreductase [Chloroflexota bacterium]
MKTNAYYPNLFSPIKIGKLEVKNRIVMCPMGTRFPTAAGYLTEMVADYYLARARGGTGLINFQYTSVTPDGAYSPRTAMLYDDRFIPGMRDLVDRLHAAGAKVCIQLAHVGGGGSYAVTGARPKGPSPVGPIGGETPLELTVPEIEDLLEAFAQAAGRAKAAGFDAVEIHGCHGYLIHQFLTPIRNRRTDEWGGDARRRAHFIVEVARRMRRVLGDDYPLLARVVVDEGLAGGITTEDGKVTARLLEEAGVDALDVTGGAQETGYLSTPPGPLARGVLAPLGEAIKQAVGVPVILVGRIHQPGVAEEIIASGKADMVALGRQMLADPDFAVKAAEGRTDEIRQCLACTSPQCHGRIWTNLPVGCVVNPELGREAQFPMVPAPTKRRVLVVGSGPAGLEAARVAALRGHSVTVVETGEEIGGQLRMGSVPPFKDGIANLVAYYRRQMELRGVEVRTACRASLDIVRAANPDVTIVATGGRPVCPPIPGVREHGVMAWDLLAGKARVGKRVALIGGGDVGCEVAEYLAQAGHAVTIVEMLPDIAPGLSAAAKPLLLRRFRDYPVDYILKTKVMAVEAGALVVERGDVRYRLSGFDDVVVCVGTTSENTLYQELTAAGLDARPVGDCVKARTIFEAVREGFEVAYSL